MTKDCSEYSGAPGRFLHDHLVERPTDRGRHEDRLRHAIDPATSTLDSDIVVSLRRGSAGYGHVVLDAGGNTGTVTLNGGTGEFRKFHARADVTCSDAVTCVWDGAYSFGR